jgi:hypothetical protein
MTQAEFTKRWKERYRNEVENSIRRCEKLNAELPTITRKITPEEKIAWSKPKSENVWSLSYILNQNKEVKKEETE